MNRAQELQLELIKLASFNNLDGEQVVKDLLDNKDLWNGVIIGRDSGAVIDKVEVKDSLFISAGMDLIALRDIKSGYNVDTIYIDTVPGKENKLELLIRRNWLADEIDWLEDKQVFNQLGTSAKHSILRVWWD